MNNYTGIDPKQPSIQTRHGRQGETKQNHLSPASRHAMGDKERQSKVIPAPHPDTPWKTKRNKWRQSKVISAQHPDTPWETRADKGRQSSIISAQHPDMPWETRGDKERQSKVIPAQHPDTPWETRAKSSQPSIQTCHGRQGETKQSDHLSPASRHAMGDKGRQRETKQNHLSPASRQRQRAGIILAQHRFYTRVENPSQQSCLGKKCDGTITTN